MKSIERIKTAIGFGLVAFIVFSLLTSFNKPKEEEVVYGPYQIPEVVIYGEAPEEEPVFEDWMFDVKHYESSD